MKSTSDPAMKHPANTGQLTLAFVICFISIMFAGIASMLMSVYLPVVVSDVLGSVDENRMNNVSAYISSFFVFGTMFGGFTWGYVCDRIGRARAVILSTVFYGVFTACTAFSDSWLVITSFRFLTGFGVGGVLVTTNILISELWPARKRAIALGIVSAAMPVGFIVAGALNNILADWHDAFLTGIVPIAAALLAAFILPEPREWNNREDKAFSAEANRVFSSYNRRNLIVGSLIFGAMLIGLWAVFSWAPTWVQSITEKKEQAQQLRGNTMMVLALAGLVGSIASGWIENAIGVRNTLMMCFAMCFVMVFVVFRLNDAVTTTTFIQMGIMSFFFGVSQGALAVFIPRLFPVHVRASATGFCFNIGRLFTATVVFFIGALVGLLGGYGNAIFVFSFIFLVGFSVTLFSSVRNISDESLGSLAKTN